MSPSRSRGIRSPRREAGPAAHRKPPGGPPTRRLTQADVAPLASGSPGRRQPARRPGAPVWAELPWLQSPGNPSQLPPAKPQPLGTHRCLQLDTPTRCTRAPMPICIPPAGPHVHHLRMARPGETAAESASPGTGTGFRKLISENSAEGSSPRHREPRLPNTRFHPLPSPLPPPVLRRLLGCSSG